MQGDSRAGWRVQWFDELDSTMILAAELANEGAPSGTVVVADFQRAGRGTRGRTWLAPPGTCLMFTVLTRPPVQPQELEHVPLQVAHSIAEKLRDITGLQVDVKPPNDLVIAGKKLCGVLCQSQLTGDRLNWLLCGVGLNTRMCAADVPLAEATSLLIEGIDPVPDHATLLDHLLDCLAWLQTGVVPRCAE